MLLVTIGILQGLVWLAKANKGYFWHVTDFHLDPLYGNKGSSCAPGGPPNPLGDYRCDSPYVLVKDAVRAMRHFKSNPDFVLWTGDDTPHVNQSLLSDQLVLDIIKNLTDELRDAFPSTPLFPALGNHDFLPKSQLPAHNNSFYDAIAEFWNASFPDASEKARFKKGGYYSVPLPHSSGRMLLLNTNLYYKSNKAVQDTEEDPAGQMAWIRNMTRNMTASRSHMLIGSHIPLGLFEKHRRWPWMSDLRVKQLSEVLLEGANSVTKGMMFGHHHTDTFRLIRHDNGSAGGVLLLAPGITPWKTTLPNLTDTGYNNPGIRLFSYNRTTGALLDYEQYHVDLVAANRTGSYNWTRLYRATEAYGVSSLSAEEMSGVANRLKEFGPLFDKYLMNNGVGVSGPVPCDVTCQQVHYCSMTQVLASRYDQCYASFTSSATTDLPGWMAVITLFVVYAQLILRC